MQTIVQIRFILFFLCCCLLNIGFSQSARAFISSLENPALADEIRPTISDFDLLAIDRGRMQSIAKDRPEQMQLTIPFEGETMVVSLHAVNIFGDDFQVLAGTKQVAQRIDYQGGALYRGEIKGKENSLVAISFFENELFGVLADQNGNINFGLLPDQPERGPLRAIIYREQAHNFPPQFTCEADNLSTTQVKPKKAPTFSPFAAKQMNSCFQNYLEGDYDLYLERNSNVTNATNWIVGMWNVVATIYDNEQLTAAISEIFIWTSPDPYGDDSSSSALSDFRSRMSNGFNGDLAHLISRNDQDNSGGLAYINVICNPNNGLRTAFSNIWSSYNQLPDYSWTVNVLAHETGHNVGSPHTHNCSWNGNGTAIDGCGTQWGDESGCPGPLPNNGGTVMSYCHLIGSVGMNLSLGFGPQPGDLIRGRVGACSNCNPQEVEGCTDPSAHNYNPLATIDDGSCETCTDGIQNGNETGVDCGGICTPCPCFDNTVEIRLNFDDYPEETRWEIANSFGGVIASGGTYPGQPDGSSLTEFVCLTNGCYSFTIFDSAADGLCCGYGIGSYSVVGPNGTVASGAEFGASETTSFCLNEDAQPSCDDGIQNGNETGVDCGGPDCLPCAVPGCTDPEAHNYNPDATVDDGSCETCTDGIQNGDETGVDCGGSLCQACSTCDDFIADIYFGNNELEVDRCPGESAELIFQYYGEVTPPLTIVYRENGVSNTLTDIIPTAGGTHTITVFPTTSTTYQLVGIVDDEGCINAGFEVQEVVYNVIDFPTPNPPTDLADCESVTLPPITGDNLDIDLRYYRLASNNNQLSPGTQITTSGDYFLVVDRLGCITELPFSITIGGPNCQVVGCTDPEAHNYNPDATVDDGSCETCTDGIQNGDETGIDCGGILCEVCPNDSLPDIGGYLLTEMGDSIAEITVAIASNTDTLWLMTDSVGNYTGPDLNPDSSYVIYPVAPPLDTNGNMASNGVSILDILMIQQQILAASDTAILSPYQMIAADVDGNGQISLIDIIASVQVILGQSTTFPIGVSWRFIDADYVFPEPYNPWYEPFPEYRLVDTVKADTMTNNFIGIKMGDLNASASAGLAPEPSRSLTLSWEDATFKAGEMITLRGQLPVSAGPQDLSYFEVSFSDALEWSGELRVAGQKPLSVDDREAGKLRFIWANLANQVQENEVQIRFRARKNGRLSQAILPNDRSLWLQKNGTYFRIKTEISPQITPQTAILEAVKLYPNPSNGLVELVLPATTVADEYQLQLLDLNGRVLQQLPLTVTDGTQRYRLDFRKNGSITSGTYVLRIQSQASRHYFRLVFR
ncbi:MAG: M12 family metallo-peptidase [Bacteroidota bacterium]